MSDAVRPIPSGGRLLHIGPHKTGSTAVQVAFHQVRPALAEHGVHYAGRNRRPKFAGWSIGLPGKRYGVPRPDEKLWRRLAAEVAAAEGRVVVSNEDFGRANREQRRRIVDDLGGDAVHLVAVARPLASYLPSQWQERVKAGVTLSWPDWLEVVLADERPEGPDGHGFEWINVWRAHDPRRYLPNWAEVVPSERFTLIVGDGSRDYVLRVFERLLELPEGLLQAPAGGSNESLSWAQVEAVRAAHLAFERRGVDRRERDPWIQRGLIRGFRETGPSGPKVPPFPAWAAEKVAELSTAFAAAVAEAGVNVLGDPVHLMPRAEIAQGDPEQLPPLSMAEAALALEAMVRATVDAVPGLGTPSEADAADAAGDADADDED